MDIEEVMARHLIDNGWDQPSACREVVRECLTALREVGFEVVSVEFVKQAEYLAQNAVQFMNTLQHRRKLMTRTKSRVRGTSNAIVYDRTIAAIGQSSTLETGNGSYEEDEANAHTWATGHNTANAIDEMGLDGDKAIGPDLVKLIEKGLKEMADPHPRYDFHIESLGADFREFMQVIKKGVSDDV